MTSQQEGDLDPMSVEGNETSATSLDMMHEVDMDVDGSSPTANLDESALLFFADATLDLSEAHDMAETPEPRRIVVETIAKPQAPSRLIEMPNLTPLPDQKSSNMQNVSRNTKIPNTSATTEHKTTPVPSTPASMQRITNADVTPTPPRSRVTTPSPAHPRPPRRPRDIPWAVSWVLLVPTSLAWTVSFHRDYSFYTQPAQWAVFNCLILAYGATFVLGRLLYRTMGGGDSDDARHVASHVILALAPVSVAVFLLMALVIYIETPDAMGYALLPLAFSVRHLWALRQWRSHQTFFQALMCMALDILSRSLRRSSFYRMVGALLGVQLCMVVWWKLAVFSAVGHGTVWVIIALVAGKWATGTVARSLGLISAGGIASWFSQQSMLMADMEHMRASEQNESPSQNSASDDASADYDVGYSTSRTLPEEYRTADASAYQSVLEMDEGIDDDYEEDNDEGGRSGIEWTNPAGGSTVKAFLMAAVTTSFGSVAQCGLLGWVAQFTWSMVRNADSISTSLSHRSMGFRGMQIGQDGRVSVIWKIFNQASVLARRFVRTHTDLAMCHVAAYYKGYQRAASDVMSLVDASGVEPIIHDDITTHMCACVCGSITGVIVIAVGTILSHGRSDSLTDEALVQSMLLAFVFCYSLLGTVMEPLRASIKAIYVCFAEHPQSLSQAFPLIFHRLSRISEANLV